MSFLQQLKQQARSLQVQKEESRHHHDAHVQVTELACRRIADYIGELPRQLNVIEPLIALSLNLDGRTNWPSMKQVEFRSDVRKKVVADKEVVDYIALGWRIVPAQGHPIQMTVGVNFPPDLEKVERRLAAGYVPCQRREQRHPQTNRLQTIFFDYETVARSSVLVTPDHESGVIGFRLGCVQSLDIVNTTYPAAAVTVEVLDELARLIVGQPSRFV